jgi:hypothetical protein
VQCILARDAGQVDKLLNGKYSAMHIAATNDHVECIKLLVKNVRIYFHTAVYRSIHAMFLISSHPSLPFSVLVFKFILLIPERKRGTFILGLFFGLFRNIKTIVVSSGRVGLENLIINNKVFRPLP